MWLQTYSSSALLLKCACFRRKKVLLRIRIRYMRMGSLYFKSKAISGFTLTVVAGDAYGHRTPNVCSLDSSFPKNDRGTTRSYFGFDDNVLHFKCDLVNFIQAFS